MSRLTTKPTKWHVRPSKTQISLGIRPVWSESSLSAWRKLQSLASHWAHSKDSNQTGRMPRLIWVFAWRTCHFVGFVMRQLKCHSRVLKISFSRQTLGKYNKFWCPKVNFGGIWPLYQTKKLWVFIWINMLFFLWCRCYSVANVMS